MGEGKTADDRQCAPQCARQPLHIVGLCDAMDDVIGPMVNKRVKVQITRRPKEGILFRDIELDE